MLQPRDEVTSPTKWVVGAELGPAGAEQVLESPSSPAFTPCPIKCPWINIPGSLQPFFLLESLETQDGESQEGGMELTGAVPRGTKPL